ncbi:polysaccharide deacetylase family protein [Chryseobacterium sp.]|uniref:polysaccharide deacetylase family protein n=1 Tax=Chryseobacterium sp. TaxID=1871047 RepID=UPI0025B8013E|nr:polysaccharide deacetylase family protein [Chryseobacterium sp.]
MIKNTLLNILAGFEKDALGKSFPLDYCLPVYHCVSDDHLPHINKIIDYKNTKQFEKDLDVMSQHFQFVDWDNFKDYINGNLRTKKKIALLTFDDGFREFHDIVVPVLERKGIYAINFINPAFIDNQELMFRCKASLILNHTKQIQNNKPVLESVLGISNSSIETIEQKILQLPYAQKKVLHSIAEIIGLDFGSYLSEHTPYMTLNQLNHLKAKGFGISSHSWDHPLYHKLSLNEQLETTFKSYEYVKKHHFLSEAFAFPFTDFGVTQVFFHELFKNPEISYSFGSAGIKRDSVKNNFQRIPMETGEEAEKIIKKEIAYFKLKKLIHKNVIIRK